MDIVKITDWLVLISVALALMTTIIGLGWRFVVRPIHDIVRRLERLDHEVGSSSDPHEDGRSLRGIVSAQTVLVNEIKQCLTATTNRIYDIEDKLGITHRPRKY